MSLAPLNQRRQRGKVRAQIVWCLLGLAVFLLLPTLRVHYFGPFYRPVEVRQSAGRHSFLAAPVTVREPRDDAGRWEPLAREAVANRIFVAALRSDAPPPITTARRRIRLRIAPPAADRSDPDIFA